MSTLFSKDSPLSGRTRRRWGILLLVLLGTVSTQFVCGNVSGRSNGGSRVGLTSALTNEITQAQVTQEPSSTECISDPAQAPAGFDPSWDLQTNITSYVMRAQDLGDLENVLESMCGDLWGYIAEPLIADTMVADVNGDEREDLLLSITLPSGNSRGNAQVYAYVFGGAGFTPYPIVEIRGAGSRTDGLYAGGGGEFLDVVDMNHEGPPEIVLAMRWDMYSEYYIANWSELGVHSLIRYIDELGMERTSILVQEGSVTVRDEDGDGLLDLVVEHQAITGSQPALTETWSWNGEVFTVPNGIAPTMEPQPFPPVAATWTPIANTIPRLPAGHEVGVTSIHMVDTTSGWAIGGAGDAIDHVLYTDDQGATWEDRTPPEAVRKGASLERRAYGFFLDGEHAWVAYSPGPLVWRTSDGGLTWSHSAHPSEEDREIFLSGDYGALIYFADTQHGWLMALLDAGMSKVYMALYGTIDGGVTWDVLIHPTTNPVLQTGRKTGISFFNAQTGWMTRDAGGVIDGAFVDWTHDGGKTWETVPIPIPEAHDRVIYYCGMHSPTLFSAQSGALGMRCPYLREGSEPSYANYLGRTKDGGQTWELHEYPGGELLFLDRDVVFALDREIYRSEDGGVNWSLVHTVNWDGEFDFVDGNHIWAVARTDDKIALVQSTNGGQSWRLIEPTVAFP